MTVDIKRTGWAQLFEQMRAPSLFFQRMFTIKPGTIYRGSKVVLEVIRDGEEISVAVTPGTAATRNESKTWTTKEFEPPAYKEDAPFNVNELLNRMAGTDPYTAANMPYAQQMVAYMARAFGLMDAKITRAVELQAAQILQTGTLSLVNADGAVTYSLDFRPKTSHFPTVGTAWNAPGSDKISDLGTLAENIRANGQVNPDRIILGTNALRDLKDDANVQEFLDNRRMEQGRLDPQFDQSGATRQGTLWVDDYEFTLWTYPATHIDPATRAVTKYMDPDKVIMMSSQTRLDRTGAEVPLPLGPDPRVASLLPGRLTNAASGVDVTPNVYVEPDGKTVVGELEARPLLVPVQIDGFGCLTTR